MDGQDDRRITIMRDVLTGEVRGMLRDHETGLPPVLARSVGLSHVSGVRTPPNNR